MVSASCFAPLHVRGNLFIDALQHFSHMSEKEHKEDDPANRRLCMASTQSECPKTKAFLNWVADEELAPESPFDKQSKAISVKQLYHWSATVSIILLLQVVSDSFHHKFRHAPSASELCAFFLLLYPLAAVLLIRFVAAARPYVPYLMGLGSLLMTLQVSWHWDRHVAEFKDGILVDQPFLRDMTACISPRQFGIADASLYRSLYGLAFGSSGLDFLDTATFFVIMFQNCVQSSFLCRLGIKITAVVSLVQALIFALWPLMSPGVFPAWMCRLLATGIWTAHLIHSSYVSESALKKLLKLSEDLRQAAELDLKNQKDGQRADSVLNHILKNTMADAIACIEMFCQRNKGVDTDGMLTKASDILFRGMWWCKLREAMLSMVAGRYETVKSATNIQQWAHDFVRGRKMALECPNKVVELDPVVCNVVLENAITNALRHGCPQDPQVKLVVEVSAQDVSREASASSSPTMQMIHNDGNEHHAEPVALRFLLTNRANSNRPALRRPWSSQDPNQEVSLKDSSRPTLSDGIGLQHISMVANSSGMVAQLWQNDDDVFFELRLDTQVVPAVTPTTVAHRRATRVVPHGLSILCLDDSPIARQSLQYMLEAEVPDARVATFGQDIKEVEDFKKAALKEGNIVILDQHVDVPGFELLGTAIIEELLAAGYAGFACIRSGNSTAADRVQSRKSGAHWHVGKELRLREMVSQLMIEYDSFLSALDPQSPTSAYPRSFQVGSSRNLGSRCRASSSSCFTTTGRAGVMPDDMIDTERQLTTHTCSLPNLTLVDFVEPEGKEIP